MSTQRKPFTWRTRWLVYKKGDGKCHICGKPLDFLESTIDHVLPVSAGGTDAIDNLMPAHLRCNVSKGGVKGEGATQHQKLRRFIRERWTQQEFAECMGLRRETVSRVLSSSTEVSPDFRIRFLDTFGLTAYAEIFGDGQPTEQPCVEAQA